MVELRENELRVIAVLDKLNDKASVEQLMEQTELQDAAVMRAALILQEEGLVKIEATLETRLKLTSEGQEYAESDLPERRLVNAVLSLGGEANLGQAAEKAQISQQFVQIALGWTQRKKWATYDSGANSLKVQTAPKQGDDERLLEAFCNKDQLLYHELSAEQKVAVETLKRRKLISVEDKTQRNLQITPAGRKAAATRIPSLVIGKKEVTQLTPELIITGKWRNVSLQKYNIEAPVARTWPGKKHPYLAFLDEVREKLVTLGFKEMTGTAVELAFFNFDALYTPQDHPARETDGIYMVKEPEYGDASAYAEAVTRVKVSHECGGETGSSGWGYPYSKREAERLILRGHGTCLSARTLLTKDLQIPSKYFSIARVYRPEVTDKTHLSEFNQVEGIVVDEKLTLRDLLGVLSKFAIEIAGADRIRFKPDYFPFTEPSVELSAYREGFGWVEFGGSGIFRPEVTQPLGVKVPVIAWGLGVDRLFMMRSRMDDIRCIFSQNLDWLRRKEVS